ncbi:response regulator [Gloeobacter kilaueensis]|uniref:Two-component response regulator n=1 Tax=Gloeobacter kilaueensis (strain ATCC BAA-2537 / CCAP 1431/1 / ULC 316 / JS1) TaxID=1183438 RepID=U5QLC5_GLOK1|nr:response regulator transcription factor [Gloeobacter kilaueensis]AGY59688.1 two-component response regulator [Gloeobacter kilaueensis JS1]
MEPIRIVLVEDHDLTRAGLRMALSQYPNVKLLAEASTGETGVKLIEQMRPDLAIVDVGLPGIDGVEVTRRAKAEFPELLVLILTMRDDAETVLAAFASGADSYCMKDIASKDLLGVIEKTHEGTSYIDPAIAGVVLNDLRSRSAHSATGGRQTSIQAADPELTQILEASPLTERELEVLQLIVKGHSNEGIAQELYITVGTVKTHVRNILSKLCADDRTQAAVLALRSGLVR